MAAVIFTGGWPKGQSNAAMHWGHPGGWGRGLLSPGNCEQGETRQETCMQKTGMEVTSLGSVGLGHRSLQESRVSGDTGLGTMGVKS